MQLDLYDNSWYHPGPKWKIFAWQIVSIVFFKTALPWPYKLKRKLLRVFGTQLGKNVIIKPHVNIKYPWKLKIGHHSWIGEGVWIDNLEEVSIGNNTCLSQGVTVICGNHDFSKKTFDLMVSPILIGDGVWLGAFSLLGPGGSSEENSVLSAGSTCFSIMKRNSIYKGNPAIIVRKRNVY